MVAPIAGGLDYLQAGQTSTDPNLSSSNSISTSTQLYPLVALQPISGQDLFRLSSHLTPNIAFYLPKNSDLTELGELAGDLKDEDGNVVGKEKVEVEEEYVGHPMRGQHKCKALTVYYGSLVNEGGGEE